MPINVFNISWSLFGCTKLFGTNPYTWWFIIIIIIIIIIINNININGS